MKMKESWHIGRFYYLMEMLTYRLFEINKVMKGMKMKTRKKGKIVLLASSIDSSKY